MGIYSPWIIGVSWPLGAALFLINRKALTLPATPAAPPPLPAQ